MRSRVIFFKFYCSNDYTAITSYCHFEIKKPTHKSNNTEVKRIEKIDIFSSVFISNVNKKNLYSLYLLGLPYSAGNGYNGAKMEEL